MEEKIFMVKNENKFSPINTVVSLFCGYGGSVIGYKLAGYDVRVIVESCENSLGVLHKNFPKVKLIERNLLEMEGKEILVKAELDKYELDILDITLPHK